ncbi:MAG: hypothetical protein GX950_03655 [Candidatus Diapherotrites archaeon]|uniref:Uncharacterized protein n=1 Tax=Candidatus Iainarchaeum sp. TaxID=3101447 RepID=A0A7K4C056_9ARCH|nr:hypothetical protein [Candidatus Diapherotrites archaeon]
MPTILNKKTNKKTNKKILNISTKGMIFSFDTMISFIIMLFVIFGSIYFISTNYEKQKENLENFYLTEKTLLTIDSLVKNHNEENYLLGSATIDILKKRVKSNELTKENLLNSKKFELNDFFVKEISWKNDLENKKIVLNQRESKKCFSSKRFVKIDGEKSIIELKGCLVEK